MTTVGLVNLSFTRFINHDLELLKRIYASSFLLRRTALPPLPLRAGFNLPATAVANTGAYSWLIGAGIASSNFKLGIVSSSDPSNFALSASFFINGESPKPSTALPSAGER